MHHYTKWECYKNGMYKKGVYNNLVDSSLILLSNPSELLKQMHLVVERWTISSEVHLSSTIDRAWLGWAACCIYSGSNEISTRISWGLMKENQKKLANMAADDAYLHYKLNKSTSYGQIRIRF